MSVKRILVIDDEESILLVVRLSLKIETDWEVLTASSGIEGIAQAQAEQPDAILLDAVLPDLDGIAIFRQLQANPASRSIPVIFLTGKVKAAEQRQLMDLGAAGIIAKPFNSLNLANRVAEILSWQLDCDAYVAKT
jgi:CheY-like chemotaxis protein